LNISKKGMGKLALLLFWPLGFGLSWIAARFPEWTEKYYALGFSKILAAYLSRLTGVFPFSLAELLIILLAVLFIIGLARVVLRMFFHQVGDKKKGLLSYLLNTFIFLGIIYFVFHLIWGMNYGRMSLAEIAGYETGGFTENDLKELCAGLILQANCLRENLPEDQNGVMELQGGLESVVLPASEAYLAAARLFPVLDGEYGRPKPVFLSKGLSYLGISGVYFPFTAEANVNTDIPDFLLPATACHEMAHQRGFAREDEANYLAWVACSSSDSPQFNYSGTIFALIYTMKTLSEVNPDQAKKLQKEYGEGLARDLRALSQYWQQYEGRAEKVASEVNDAYLKSNRQAGIESYDRMVTLLLAEAKSKTYTRIR